MSRVVGKSASFKNTSLGGGFPFQSIVGGHYRLTVTLSVNANAGAVGSIYPAVSWNDTYGAQSLSTVIAPPRVGVPYASGGIASWSGVVYISPSVVGGTVSQVNLTTDNSLSAPVPVGSEFDLHCLVEELSAPLVVTAG